ncbi:helix-turn-helix domain-containing protein [Marinifilum flexuosum]|uniref:DnaA-like protein n=1 Tax=Marinifilum flexuosum TaxID=1117708 RepID=A0A419X3N7_9BACT|nr:helix-turn-helix domain-containing protein [Marinifilum flexuosum]RKE02331.1 DnaA-like protein [Marinifilum flexuosum]
MKRTFPTEFQFLGNTDSKYIIRVIADVFKVDFNAIFTRTKYRPVADARQVSAVLLNKLKGFTHQDIAWLLERDVSIVSYSKKAVKDKFESDKEFAAKFNKALSLLMVGRNGGTPKVFENLQDCLDQLELCNYKDEYGQCLEMNVAFIQLKHYASKNNITLKKVCPHCGSTKVIMFTSDSDMCQNCKKEILP